MFRCDACSRVTDPGEAMTRVVAETRVKKYHDDTGEVIGTGREIVREERHCPKCVKPPKAPKAGTP